MANYYPPTSSASDRSTPQLNKLIRGFNNAINNRQYCSAAFLDISQAFDKVWHKGLLYKIRRSLPLNFFLILNSYLSTRHFIVKVDTELTGLTLVNAAFADDTAVIATDYDPATASQKLQTSFLEIQSWLNTWGIKANETKSVHVTFTTRRETCPPGHINDVQVPQENHVKYLGLHLDRRLTWHRHIFAKRKQLGLSLIKMYWLLGRKSKLSINNKLLVYKAKLKSIWTYDIQLWDTTSNSNINILERFQSKVLRLIVDAAWYVSNSVIRKELQIPIVKEEISRFSSLYAVRLRAHTNELIATFTEPPIHKRLRRYWLNDLLTRF
jgi:hypothetical protein